MTEGKKKKRKSKAKSRVAVKCPECKHAFLPDLKTIQSRAGRSSRAKGAGFERKIAKKLKEWWPGDREFKRTPMSGGSVLKDGFDMAGDICTNVPDFPWHLELKNVPSQFTGLHNFFSDKSIVWKWFGQACDESPSHRIPMLIFNRFDQPTYCGVMFDKDSYIQDRLYKSDIKYFELNNGKRVFIFLFADMIASDPENWK